MKFFETVSDTWSIFWIENAFSLSFIIHNISIVTWKMNRFILNSLSILSYVANTKAKGNNNNRHHLAFKVNVSKGANQIEYSSVCATASKIIWSRVYFQNIPQPSMVAFVSVTLFIVEASFDRWNSILKSELNCIFGWFSANIPKRHETIVKIHRHG